MDEETEYEFYYKLLKQTRNNASYLNYLIEESKPLMEVYDRKIFIYEEIVGDLGPQLDDPQYCGVVSWGYEQELKELNENESLLKEKYDEVVKQLEYKSFLADLNMTHEEWQRKEEEDRKNSIKKRLRK